MAVQGWRLVFRVFMKMLLETQTGNYNIRNQSTESTVYVISRSSYELADIW